MPLFTTQPDHYDPGYEMPEVPPLCLELYNRLQARIPGGVRIANQGEEMTGNVVQDSGRRYWSVATWGETYRVNCPFCKESRHRLWISHRFGQPDPADATKLGMFYGICFNMDCLREPGNRKALYDDIFGIRNRNILRNPPAISQGERYDGKLKAVHWPGHVTPLWRMDPGHVAWRYLAGDRGFDHNTAITYNLHYCTQGDHRFGMMTDRIVAPFIQFNQMVGWQGRFVGEPPHKGIPKYYTMPGMPKRQILYNHDRSVDHPFVVVFEGITDVWRFGDPSVAICGKTMSTGQRLLLQQSWPGKPIILCLDPEAREESAGILHELNKSDLNPLVNIQLDMGWDPAKYTTETLWNIVYSQANAIGVQLPEIR
jgi:hypothetical protein